MKLSVVIADENAPESAFVVWRGFKESMEKARRFGYQGVELALGCAEDIDAEKLRCCLQSNGLSVSCISTGLTYARLGLYMTHPASEKRREIVTVFRGLTLLAERHGGLINVGRARGFVAPGQTREEAEFLFLDCRHEILPFAAQRGVTILIEPINRYESNFLNNVDAACALLKRLPFENVGVMADLFHMNIEDDRIGASIRRNKRSVNYVHIADSNRRAPGQGHTDFGEVLDALEEISYDGWLSAEVLPGKDADGTALATAQHMRARMKERGLIS